MHPYGLWSLVPPLVAVVLAIATRRIVPSLLAGILAGALVTTGGNVLQAVVDMAEVHLWSTLVLPGKLRLFVFTVSIGATVGLIYANGGMRGLVDLIEPLARSRRSGQITAWLAGMVVFFDDYANTLLLGNTFRATFDRLKLSREKLAYVVDSTSAPVAGLALISTWIAVEMDYLQQGINQLDAAVASDYSALDLFISCLPYRFYVIQALLFVPIVALMGREFGPMLAAERRRLAQTELDQHDDQESQDPDLNVRDRSHWLNGVVPILVTLITVVALMIATGRATIGDAAQTLTGWVWFREVFGAANSSLALQYGGLAGVATAVLLSVAGRLLSTDQCMRAATRGARMMVPALVILWLASGLSRMTTSTSYDGQPSAGYEHQDHRLYTGDYLVEQLRELASDPTSSAWLVAGLPTIIFLLSSFVAFSTGTSYGTMGLMVPLVIPLVYAALAAAGTAMTPDNPILLASAGSVLAGAIFGDHCSPLSDTTILSSQASGCGHVAHVRTQLPYALAVAGASILLGTAAIGLGVNVWLLLPLQTASLVGTIWFFGSKPEA